MKRIQTTKAEDTAVAVKLVLLTVLPELSIFEDSLSYLVDFSLTYSNCSITVMIALSSSGLDTSFSCYSMDSLVLTGIITIKKPLIFLEPIRPHTQKIRSNLSL